MMGCRWRWSIAMVIELMMISAPALCWGIEVTKSCLVTAPREGRDPQRPHPLLTAGRTRTVVTDNVCRADTSTFARSASDAETQEVYAAYCIPEKAWGNYMIDHLIPLELGGSSVLENLWPQPKESAHDKDSLEKTLSRLVCADQLALETAQQAIATNWMDAFQTYVHPSTRQERIEAATVCFTPGGKCTAAMIHALNAATRTVLVQAYSFTQPPSPQRCSTPTSGAYRCR
jgi:hypothetical protein